MKNDGTGFVIEPRTITKNEWYTDPLTMHLLRHCRQKANFEVKVWRGTQIERGQFVTSLKNLSTETGLSVMQVRTALEKLEKTGYITNKSTNKYRIITYVFYDEEQKGNKQSNKRVNKQITNKLTNKQQTNNNQITTTNNINNNNNEEQGVCAPSAHTQQEEAASPRAPSGERGRAEQPTYEDVRRFQIENHIGGGEDASEFFNGFEKSGTLFPKNWQRVYTKFAKAPYKNQSEFIDKLESGGYREKWGAVE